MQVLESRCMFCIADRMLLVLEYSLVVLALFVDKSLCVLFGLGELGGEAVAVQLDVLGALELLVGVVELCS